MVDYADMYYNNWMLYQTMRNNSAGQFPVNSSAGLSPVPNFVFNPQFNTGMSSSAPIFDYNLPVGAAYTPSFNFSPSFSGNSLNSGSGSDNVTDSRSSTSGYSVEDLNKEYERKLAETFVADKTRVAEQYLFSPEDAEIIKNAYEKNILNPPSESLLQSAGSQAAFGVIMNPKSIYSYTTNKITRKGLSEVAKEPMKIAGSEVKWTDFIKPSKTFKEKQEFNNAVNELFKKTGKLEKAKRVDNDLYNEILKRAQEAIKSGDIKEVKKVTEAAGIAKKARTVEAFNTAIRTAESEAASVAGAAAEATTAAAESAAAATEATASAAEASMSAAATATATAERTAGSVAAKTTFKSLLKGCTKFMPIIGNLVFAACEVIGDRSKLKAAKEKGGDALTKQCVHTGARAGVVVAGFSVGMKIGAAIGTCIPVPVLGTVVGAVAGGIIGGALSWAGAKLAKWTTTKLLGPEPGIEARRDQLANNENNKCVENGQLNQEKFQNSGMYTMAKELAQLGPGKLDDETIAVLNKYSGYLNPQISSPVQG